MKGLGVLVVFLLGLHAATAMRSALVSERQAGEVINGRFELIHRMDDPDAVHQLRSAGADDETLSERSHHYRYAQTLLQSTERTTDAGDGSILLAAQTRKDSSKQSFTLQKLLDRGTFGEVWKATDRATGENYALKCYCTKAYGTSASSRRAEYEKEIRLANDIQTPASATSKWNTGLKYIIRLLDHFRVTNSEGVYEYFTVWPLMDGDFSAMAEKGTLIPSRNDMNTLTASACWGMAYLQDNHVTHSDIKPANIFFKKTDKGLVSIIGDMGLTHNQHRSQQLGYVCGSRGSPFFFAPETGSPACRAYAVRTNGLFKFDAWATGMTLWSAMSGHAFRDAFYDKFSKMYQYIGARVDLSTGLGVLSSLFHKSDPYYGAISDLLVADPLSRATAKDCAELMKSYLIDYESNAGVAKADYAKIIGDAVALPVRRGPAMPQYPRGKYIWKFAFMQKMFENVQMYHAVDQVFQHVKSALEAVSITSTGRDATNYKELREKLEALVDEGSKFAANGAIRTNVAATKEAILAVQKYSIDETRLETYALAWCDGIADAAANSECKSKLIPALKAEWARQSKADSNINTPGVDDMAPCMTALYRAARDEVIFGLDTLNLAKQEDTRQCGVCVAALSVFTHYGFESGSMACTKEEGESVTPAAGSKFLLPLPRSMDEYIEAANNMGDKIWSYGQMRLNDYAPIAASLGSATEADNAECGTLVAALNEKTAAEKDAIVAKLKDTETRGPRFICNDLKMCPSRYDNNLRKCWDDDSAIGKDADCAV